MTTTSPSAAGTDRCCEAGFTLVEFLVAIALFSILTSVLFGSVQFGLKAWRHGAAHADRLEHELIVQNLLRRLLSDAYPLVLADSAGRPQVDFSGAADVVTFVASTPAAAGEGGRFRFKLRAERQENRTDLIMFSAPELAERRELPASTRTVLLANIERADFSYFGTSGPDQVAKWHNQWAQRSDMPKLVRIRVTLRSDDGRTWPDLIVAPRVAADVTCIYDPITKRCRGR